MWKSKKKLMMQISVYFSNYQKNTRLYVIKHTSKHFDRRYGKTENGFFTNGYFSPGDEGEIDTNRFFKDSNELAKFIDKIFNKFDDHPSICYTGNNYRYFRNFKRVNRSGHGRDATKFNNILESEGLNCHTPNGNGCFLNCISFTFKKDFSMKYFEFIQSYKRRTNVLTRCRIPEFCERYKTDIGINDPEANEYSLGMLKRRIYVYTFIKILIVVSGRKIDEIV